MSEKNSPKFETTHNYGEQPRHHEKSPTHERRHEQTHEQTSEKQEKSLEEIRRTVEASATAAEQLKNEEFEHPDKETSQVFVQQELKKITLKKTLTRVQKKLPGTERAFSKVVHAPIVDTISNVGEKTFARPIGILGGGAMALLGATLSTYLSRRFGMSYNIFMFVIFFVVGYLFSTIIELLYRIVFKSRIKS